MRQSEKKSIYISFCFNHWKRDVYEFSFSFGALLLEGWPVRAVIKGWTNKTDSTFPPLCPQPPPTATPTATAAATS